MAECFGAVCNARSKMLILGSMPGEASLRAGQYYAHPRNSFWPVMECILGARAPLSYRARLALLKKHRIALWDVLGYCARRGSADSAIDMKTARANDFESFFRAHKSITAVFFNGSKAQACYNRYVLPALGPDCGKLRYLKLPSTSPAYATLSAAQKTALWKREIMPGLAEEPG
ncbi:MAG: DNA-deoxyinosine glycosylase [Elusimicrobiaceae bacterium]|nr:DNA-deoxyinosine glycosylase [Elusimicrobiaceae bacterium]